METKICAKCKRQLPASSFSKRISDKSCSLNLESRCRECRSKDRKVATVIKIANKSKTDKKLKVNILSEKDAAYIAGFLDGEGCICLHKTHANDKNRKQTYHLKVRITNTFPGIMEWIHAVVGSGSLYTKKKYPGANKQGWDWQITGRRAIDLLNQLYPYMKVKRLQAEVAFEFGETISYPGQNKLTDEVIDIRDGLRTRLSVLNN